MSEANGTTEGAEITERKLTTTNAKDATEQCTPERRLCEALRWTCGAEILTDELDSDGFSWVCTRDEGHPGPHIACGLGEHNLHTWPQAEGKA